MDRPPYGRRRFLAAVAVLGVGAAIGVGVDDLVASPDAKPKKPKKPNLPVAHGLVSGSFHSVRRGVEVGWTVSLPPGWVPGDRVPLCLVLHGFSADHTYAFDDLHLQDVQGALATGKPSRPMVLAAADGGNGYWHPRADGDDPQGMLMDEFLPLVHTMGVDTDQVVAFGWSMGGYGSILLAETYPHRIMRVGAESPAIWPSYAGSQNANPTAFDSAADWSAHDVVGHLAELDQIPVRVDCGLSDPFIPASRQLATLLPAGEVDLSPGGHDVTFWQAHAPAQLQFLAS